MKEGTKKDENIKRMLNLDNEVLALVEQLRNVDLSPRGKAALECMERLAGDRKKIIESITQLEKIIQKGG